MKLIMVVGHADGGVEAARNHHDLTGKRYVCDTMTLDMLDGDATFEIDGRQYPVSSVSAPVGCITYIYEVPGMRPMPPGANFDTLFDGPQQLFAAHKRSRSLALHAFRNSVRNYFEGDIAIEDSCDLMLVLLDGLTNEAQRHHNPTLVTELINMVDAIVLKIERDLLERYSVLVTWLDHGLGFYVERNSHASYELLKELRKAA